MSRYLGHYDASSDADALTVVGLVTPEDSWVIFEGAWAGVLDDFQVPYFHMREFAHGIGPFSSWKNDKGKQKAFLETLIQILKSHIEIVFSQGLNLRDFLEVNRVYQLSEPYGGPYSYCAGSCMLRVQRWLKESHPDCSILHIIEAGDQGSGALIRNAQGEGMEVIKWQKSNLRNGQWWAGFQGADLWAWEDRRGLSDAIRDAPEKHYLRKSLIALHREVLNDSVFRDKEGMVAMCEAHPDAFRKRLVGEVASIDKRRRKKRF